MADLTSSQNQTKLLGLCYENTVIDRKGRIRKIKPPVTSKPRTPTQPQNLKEDCTSQHFSGSSIKPSNLNNANETIKFQSDTKHSEEIHANEPNCLESSEPVWKERPGVKIASNPEHNRQEVVTTGQDIFRNQQQLLITGQSIIRDKQGIPTTGQEDILRDKQGVPVTGQDIFRDEQVVTSTGQDIFSEKQGVPATGQDIFRDEQVVTSTGQDIFSDKQGVPATGQDIFRDEQRVTSTGQDIFGDKQGVTTTGQDIFRDEQGVTTTGQDSFSDKQGVPATRQDIFREKQEVVTAGSDIICNVENYKDVLLKGAQLRFKVHKIQKHKIHRFEDGVIAVAANGKVTREEEPIRDVYELALDNLVEDDDDDDEDDDDDDEDGCSRSLRSESPDTLVERILETIDDEDGGIVLDFEGDTFPEKPPRRKLNSQQKSFSDEILERLGETAQKSAGVAPANRSAEANERSETSTNRNGTYDGNKARKVHISEQQDVDKVRRHSELSSAAAAAVIRLDRYIIEQQPIADAEPAINYAEPKVSEAKPNINHAKPSNSHAEPNHLLPAASLITTAAISSDVVSQSAIAKVPVSSNKLDVEVQSSETTIQLADSRFARERSPEEIFEEIVEALRDTEGEYEDPFFYGWPGSYPAPGQRSRNTWGLRTDGDPIDYSVENDWLSFFYCNRVNAAGDATGATASQRRSSVENSRQAVPKSADGVGIFVNSSLSSSSSWMALPARGTFPRTNLSKQLAFTRSEDTDDASPAPKRPEQVPSKSTGPADVVAQSRGRPSSRSSRSEEQTDDAIQSNSGPSRSISLNQPDLLPSPASNLHVSDGQSSTENRLDVATADQAGGLSCPQPADIFSVLQPVTYHNPVTDSQPRQPTGEKTQDLRSTESNSFPVDNPERESSTSVETSQELRADLRSFPGVDPEEVSATADHPPIHSSSDGHPTGRLFAALDAAFARNVERTEAKPLKGNDDDSAGETDDTLTPKYDTLTPKNDTMTPKYDTLTPKNDTLTPKYDTLTPKYDTMTPKGNILTSKSNTMTPKSNILTSKDDACTPMDDIIQKVSMESHPDASLNKQTLNSVSYDTVDDLSEPVDREHEVGKVSEPRLQESSDFHRYLADSNPPESQTESTPGTVATAARDEKRMTDHGIIDPSHTTELGAIPNQNDADSSRRGEERSAEIGIDIPKISKFSQAEEIVTLEATSNDENVAETDSQQTVANRDPMDPVNIPQPHPPKRVVKVLSDEVTTQTVLLKIAWPAAKGRERSRERIEQPYRELQLRRTIRMTDPASNVPQTGREITPLVPRPSRKNHSHTPSASGETFNDETVESPSNYVVNSKDVATSNGFINCDETQSLACAESQSPVPSSLATRPEFRVEYENQERSHDTEVTPDATVDVTRTDSVKVLLVPMETVYKVQDLKEIVAAVGKTILNDSQKIPIQSSVRVTCEAVQSKSCAAAVQDRDVTIIRNTILDTYKASVE